MDVGIHVRIRLFLSSDALPFLCKSLMEVWIFVKAGNKGLISSDVSDIENEKNSVLLYFLDFCQILLYSFDNSGQPMMYSSWMWNWFDIFLS